MIDGDRDRLAQVIGNLLSNAIKYSPAGGAVRVHVELEGDRAVLMVNDQGMGIDEADRERVFEKFFRSSEASARIAGTGLGLAVAREIVETHGGRDPRAVGAGCRLDVLDRAAAEAHRGNRDALGRVRRRASSVARAAPPRRRARPPACSGPGTSPLPSWKRRHAASGLPAPRAQAGDALEVGHERDRAACGRRRAGSRRSRSAPPRPAAARAARRGRARRRTGSGTRCRSRANSGMLPLPCAVDDRDRLLVGVVAERREDERATRASPCVPRRASPRARGRSRRARRRAPRPSGTPASAAAPPAAGASCRCGRRGARARARRAGRRRGRPASASSRAPGCGRGSRAVRSSRCRWRCAGGLR